MLQRVSLTYAIVMTRFGMFFTKDRDRLRLMRLSLREYYSQLEYLKTRKKGA
jgi:hypothetical protein